MITLIIQLAIAVLGAYTAHEQAHIAEVEAGLVQPYIERQ